MAELPDREPSDDYRLEECHRLQPYDPMAGTLWIGTTQSPPVHYVWAAAEDFRRYVNLLIEVYGNVTYGELKEKAQGKRP